jgi:predicted phage gp36 major capsid-like protein
LVAKEINLEEAHTAVEVCLEGSDNGISLKKMIELYLKYGGNDQDAIHEEIERLVTVATQNKQRWAGRKPGRGANRTRRAMGKGGPVPNINISEPEE